MEPAVYLLSLSAFLFGLRHGVDWDHIAAITDFTATTHNKKSAVFFSSAYIAGHATVVILLGTAAILTGLYLPDWFDFTMEKVVGLTLIILGIWILFSIVLHGKNSQIQSRGMLLFVLLSTVYNRIHNKLLHTHERSSHRPQRFGLRTSYFIGLIHGIGAETPTQILLFLTAIGISGKFSGVLLLISFVIGLMISNFFITISSIFIYSITNYARVLYIIFGIVNAIFSIIIGIFFLSGDTSLLPALLGG